MQSLSDAPVASLNTGTQRAHATLPVMFINRQGEPELAGLCGTGGTLYGDAIPFSQRGEVSPIPVLNEQPLAAALNRLQRALFETGQLVITPRDGLTRICFAGIGDPDCLFVEAVPRDQPVPVLDFEFPGCLCSLPQAEAILRRIYRGESSEALAEFLSSRSDGQASRPEAA